MGSCLKSPKPLQDYPVQPVTNIAESSRMEQGRVVSCSENKILGSTKAIN